MHVWQIARQGERRFDAVAEVYAYNSAAPHSAASFVCRPLPQPPSRTTLPSKNSRFDRLQPAQELVGVFGVFLSKVRPLPTEIFRRFGFILLRSCRDRQTADPRSTLYSRVHFLHESTPSMISLSSYLPAFDQQNITAASWACEHIQ
jgi:hypothetical protein